VCANLENNEDLQKIVRSTIGTKFSSKWGDLLVDLAVQAVRTVWSKDE
jgi:T-complex protein 1 subunit gamma